MEIFRIKSTLSHISDKELKLYQQSIIYDLYSISMRNINDLYAINNSSNVNDDMCDSSYRVGNSFREISERMH